MMLVTPIGGRERIEQSRPKNEEVMAQKNPLHGFRGKSRLFAPGARVGMGGLALMKMGVILAGCLDISGMGLNEIPGQERPL